MKTTRQPQRVRALLCAGAAAAVLLGGGSSYALWADTAENQSFGEEGVIAGEWEWTVAATNKGWWDTSEEYQAATIGQPWGEVWAGPSDSGWSEKLAGDAEAETVRADVNGYPIDKLADYPIVPGDQITGKFTIDAVLTELVGQNLRAEITKIDPSGKAGVEADALPLEVKVEVVNDGEANEVFVIIDYPIGEKEVATEQVAEYHKSRADEVSGNGKTATVNLGEYEVTLTQVRPRETP